MQLILSSESKQIDQVKAAVHNGTPNGFKLPPVGYKYRKLGLFGGAPRRSERPNNPKAQPEKKPRVKRSYDVEKILGHQVFSGNGTIYYRVKWKNFPEEQATWEPFKNVDGCAALVEYELERERIKRNKNISDFVRLIHSRYAYTDTYSDVVVDQNMCDVSDVEPPEIAFVAVNGMPKIEPVDDFDVAIDEAIQPAVDEAIQPEVDEEIQPALDEEIQPAVKRGRGRKVSNKRSKNRNKKG